MGEDDFGPARLCARGLTMHKWQTVTPARSLLVPLLRVACRELIPAMVYVNSCRYQKVHSTWYRPQNDQGVRDLQRFTYHSYNEGKHDNGDGNPSSSDHIAQAPDVLEDPV